MTVSTIQNLSEVVESKVGNDNKVATSSIGDWCSKSWRKIFSEFLATLILMLLGCMTCVPIPGYESPVIPALGFGMIVMVNIQIFGHISGAYMNPSVTLASIIWGGTPFALGIAYIIAQCAGAIAGYGILDALTSMDLAEGIVCVSKSHYDQSVMQSIGIEASITAVLIFINCALWDPVNKHFEEASSIKFGLTIIGLSLAAGPFTGAGMNPARSLAPAVWTNIWAEQWVFWVGPISGSIVAVLLYKYIFLKKQATD